MTDRALLRRLAVLQLDQGVKTAQALSFYEAPHHPVEMQRRMSGYNVGLHDLMNEFGVSEADPIAAQRLLAENEDYYNRLRALHDQYFGAPTLSEAVAAEKRPTDISAENAPKVVSTPK